MSDTLAVPESVVEVILCDDEWARIALVLVLHGDILYNQVLSLHHYAPAEPGMKIVHYPHPALRHKARPLTQIDKDLRLAVGRMFELMYEAVGLGLAATQVALPHQLLVMNMTGKAEEKDQECVYINPVIVERKGYQEGDEGCLSFPGLFQKVRRAKTVKVQAYDMQGQLVELTASDLEARAWQHELDHLDGVLYIDKFGPIARLSARGSLKEFEREFRQAQERGEIPANLELEKVLAELAGQS